MVAAVAALASLFFGLIWKYSVNVFFYDQWEFLAAFFQHEPSLVELFRWHGPSRRGSRGAGVPAARVVDPGRAR